MTETAEHPARHPTRHPVPTEPSAQRKDPLAMLVLVLVLIGACVSLALAWNGYQAARDYEAASEQVANLLAAENATEILTNKAVESVTFGYWKPHSQWQQKLEAAKAAQLAALERSREFSVAFFGVIAATLLLLLAWANRLRRPARPLFAAGLAWASLPALIVGLSAPMLMIVAYKNLAVVGEVVFRFESKGVMSTIGTLFESGNVVIGVLIALFSVALPLLKTLGLLIATIPAIAHRGAGLLRFFHHIGKWSMADVFVVALLLSYFITDDADLTRAEVQAGFYFFTGYVLMSLVASQLLSDKQKVARQTP